MEKLSIEQRQLQGCGFLPPPSERLRPFVQPSIPLGYDGPPATVCPGYSTSLPETIECARAHRHWSKGSIDVFTARGPDEPAIEGLRDGVEIFEGSVNETSNWVMRNPVKA